MYNGLSYFWQILGLSRWRSDNLNLVWKNKAYKLTNVYDSCKHVVSTFTLIVYYKIHIKSFKKTNKGLFRRHLHNCEVLRIDWHQNLCLAMQIFKKYNQCVPVPPNAAAAQQIIGTPGQLSQRFAN